MPSPIQLLLDPVSLTVFALFGALILLEHWRPARALPQSAYWRSRGLSAFMIFFFVSSYLPLWWSEYFARYQLFDLSAWGTVGGALAGLLVYEAGVYFWHRAMHHSTWLWHGFHQMHHSAERVDTFGAFWFSPLDMLGWTALSSLCLTLIVGITPEAASWVLYATTFFSVFQHANLRTPRWLGYIVQRPESHSHHHERGVHARNYSDLPMFDLVFGTFYNPRHFAGETGFYPGASNRLGEMLSCRDVSEPPTSASGVHA